MQSLQAPNKAIITWKRLIALALPMAGTQFVNVASGFFCMAMLASLGHQVLAASALIFSTQLAVMVSGMSLLFSLSVLVGHAYGAKDYLSIGTYLQQCWVLAILIGLPMMVFFWHIGTILHQVGEPAPLIDIITQYFHTFVWAVIPGFLSTANMQFGYALHKRQLMVMTSFFGVGVLVSSAYVLIFGKFGLPACGVAGLAYATIFQYAFFFLVTTTYYYIEPSFKKFELFRFRVHQHLDHFTKMLKIGWPISVQMGGEMLSFFVSGIMIGWLGVNALAAFQIVNQYYFLIIIPVFSLSQASGILVGQAMGAKQTHEVATLSKVTLLTVLAVSGVIAILFAGFPRWLASAYLDVSAPSNALTLDYTIIIFTIIAVSQCFDNIRNALIGILRGIFDTRFAMISSVLSIWLIGMPLTYVFAFIFHLGVPGFVIGGMLGMLAGVLMMLFRWRMLVYKQKGWLDGSPPFTTK